MEYYSREYYKFSAEYLSQPHLNYACFTLGDIRNLFQNYSRSLWDSKQGEVSIRYFIKTFLGYKQDQYSNENFEPFCFFIYPLSAKQRLLILK